jgi:hypothetical protein
VYDFETEFTLDTSDGRQVKLTSRAVENAPETLDAELQFFQHGALGQTPIALPAVVDQAVGWWETVGDTRNATAAARSGGVAVELHIDDAAAGDPVTDSQIGAWLSSMVQRATVAPDVGNPDWHSLMPAQPQPWRFVLDSGSVGRDWAQTSGLQVSSSELDGSVQSVSASRAFSRSAPYQRTLTSMATVFPTADQAVAVGMVGAGAAVPSPTLGDQSAEFKTADSGGGREAPTVTYTVDVRRGAVVASVQETGVVYSLDSPAEPETFAARADALAASVLSE